MRSLMCVGIVSLVLAAGCSTEGVPLTDVERQALATSVDSATRAFEQAQRALDPQQVLAHLAVDFYMYNDGVRVGRDETVTQIEQTLTTLRHLEPGFRDIEVMVLGRDGAVASFTFHDSLVDATGMTMRFRGVTTLVWERRDLDWLITYADSDHYTDSLP